MALKSDGKEQEDSVDDKAQKGTGNGRVSIDSEEEEDDDEEDEEDEEPRLKYASLTKSLGPVYRNADATSAFLVGGDKMVGFLGETAAMYTEHETGHWDTQWKHCKLSALQSC